MLILHTAIAVALIAVLPFLSLAAKEDSDAKSFVIEKEFEAVTCGSSVKLTNKATGFRLHSHEIAYGTGSGQQSVTGFPNGDDPNSLFVVHGGFETPPCKRGTPIRCNDVVRLQHLNTGKFLHSHGGVPSPLSRNQEVSAHGSNDSGDNWTLGCVGGKAKFWQREKTVTLKHVDTGYFIGASKRFRFEQGVAGQLEVSGRPLVSGDDERWAVQEGVFFANIQI